jgi:tellurite resistance protein
MPRKLDEALMTLFIGAMNANGHVSPEEGARAHHLIWSTRRFRRRSGEAVGSLIERVRARFEVEDATALEEAAARAIPRALRASAFAVVADLLLADGRIDAGERRYLQRLAADLKIVPRTSRTIVDTMLLKNTL